MKTPSLAFLRVAIIIGSLCVLGGLLTTIWFQVNLNSVITSQSTISQSIDEIALETKNIGENVSPGLIKQVEALQAKVDELKAKDEELNNSLNSIKTNILLGEAVGVLGLFMLFISLITTFGTDRSIKAALKNSYDQGRSKGAQDAIVMLDKNPSILLNMMNWLILNRRGKARPEAAQQIFEDFFTRAQERFGLQPFGMVGETLNFDHKKHDNHSANVRPGDKVRVIEAGWKIGNTIIRKPMVEKE